MKETITYYYRGLVERGPHYQWHKGYSAYSDGQPLYPWETRRECQQDAKKHGLKAIFVDDRKHYLS